jgi:hypothetical protein
LNRNAKTGPQGPVFFYNVPKRDLFSLGADAALLPLFIGKPSLVGKIPHYLPSPEGIDESFCLIARTY